MFSEVEEDSKFIAVGLQQQGKWTTWADMWRIPQAHLNFLTYNILQAPRTCTCSTFSPVEWPDSADAGWNPGGKQAWGRRVQSRTSSEEDPLCDARRPGPVQHCKAMVSKDSWSWIELDEGSSSICPQYWPCLCCEIQHRSPARLQTAFNGRLSSAQVRRAELV